tara:strand:+ start:1403 stop:1600 length:198 start_codon:yes stop_codon:yes gene_type:complete
MIEKHMQIAFTVEVYDRLSDSTEPILTLDHEDYTDEVCNLMHNETLKVMKENDKNIKAYLSKLYK